MILSPIVGNRHRKRHTGRPDILLHWDPLYRAMRVQTGSGPLIANYLETLYRVMYRAIQSNKKVLAIRIDLRYPEKMNKQPRHDSNIDIVEWLKNLHRELKQAGIKHPHNMRYVWCREQYKGDKHHYHVLLLFNGNAYFRISGISSSENGCYDEDNLYHRIVRAWCKAIEWPPEMMNGLVHVAERDKEQKNKINKLNNEEKKEFHWIIHRDDPASFAEVFHAASYLCKVYSKPLMQINHCFNASRKRHSDLE